jgi:hypothetical protein
MYAVLIAAIIEDITMKYTYSKKTKTFRLQQALQAGEVITSSVAEQRFGIKNLTAEITRVRQNGYPVRTNTRVEGNNVRVTEYVLSKAPREIVALGYLAKSMGLSV